MTGFDENWLRSGGIVPIDANTTAALVAEIKRLRSTSMESHHLRQRSMEIEKEYAEAVQNLLVAVKRWDAAVRGMES